MYCSGQDLKIEPDQIEMIEVSEKAIAGYRYSLKKLSPGQTLLSIEMLVRDNPILKLGFSIVYKSSMKKKVHRFFENLGNFVRTNNSSGAEA